MVLKISLFFSLLLTASLIDIKTHRIPNWLTLGGFISLLVITWFSRGIIPLDFLISALISFSLMLLLVLLSKGKLGMGDAKLTLLMGGTLGLYYWFFALLFASLTGLAFALLFLGLRKGKMKETPMAFAPFLSLGALAAWILKKEGLFVL